MKSSLFNKIYSLMIGTAVAFSFASCGSTSLALTQEAAEIFSAVAESQGMDKTAAAITAGAKSATAAMEDITPENEYYIGRAVAATVLSNYKFYSNSKQEAYLNKICRTITENSDVPEIYNGYHVKILDTTEINAFATSGGHIFVTRGLISCTDSEDALAAVLAHEVAHIQLKHSLKAIKASRWAGVVASAGAAAASKDELATSLNTMVNDVISSMVNNGYSQASEYDADAKALTLMAQAGYNPSAMNSLLGKMKANQGTSKSGFGKTHPSPDLRIASVKKNLISVKAPADTSAARKARFASSL